MKYGYVVFSRVLLVTAIAGLLRNTGESSESEQGTVSSVTNAANSVSEDVEPSARAMLLHWRGVYV